MSLHRGVQGTCATPPVAHHSTGTSSSTGDSISSWCSDYKQLGRLPAIAAPRFPACTTWRFESSQARVKMYNFERLYKKSWIIGSSRDLVEDACRSAWFHSQGCVAAMVRTILQSTHFYNYSIHTVSLYFHTDIILSQ